MINAEPVIFATVDSTSCFAASKVLLLLGAALYDTVDREKSATIKKYEATAATVYCRDKITAINQSMRYKVNCFHEKNDALLAS